MRWVVFRSSLLRYIRAFFLSLSWPASSPVNLYFDLQCLIGPFVLWTYLAWLPGVKYIFQTAQLANVHETKQNKTKDTPTRARTSARFIVKKPFFANSSLSAAVFNTLGLIQFYFATATPFLVTVAMNNSTLATLRSCFDELNSVSERSGNRPMTQMVCVCVRARGAHVACFQCAGVCVRTWVCVGRTEISLRKIYREFEHCSSLRYH